MERNSTPATRGTSSGPVPYTGPLYTQFGREYAPAQAETVSAPAVPRYPVRPC